MALVVNTNVGSLNAQRQLNAAQGAMQRTMERLASGLRINRASDDAAGMAIVEQLEAEIRGLEQARRNSATGVSLVQTGEGAFTEISSIMTRMNELAVQAADGALTDTDRAALQTEFSQLTSEIDRIAGSTEFNGKKLLNGSLAAGVDLQVGTNNTSNDRISVSIPATNATTLGLSGLSLATQAGAQGALGSISSAIDTVVSRRAELGAFQNRLETAGNAISGQVVQQSAARSRIRDADIALESANFARQNISFQGATAMLAQANQFASTALRLLGR